MDGVALENDEVLLLLLVTEEVIRLKYELDRKTVEEAKEGVLAEMLLVVEDPKDDPEALKVILAFEELAELREEVDPSRIEELFVLEVVLDPEVLEKLER